MLKKSFFFFLLFLSGQVAFGQDSLLTVQKAVEILLKNNFSITISTNEAQIAKNNNTLGNAGILPALDLQAAGSEANNNTKQNFVTGTTVDKSGVTSSNISAAAALNWTIFDGLNMFATKSKLTELEAQGELNLKIQIEDAMLQAIQTYFSIVQQQQLTRALNEEIVVSQEREKIADRKLSNGSGSKLDLLQAKVDLNAQRSALLRQQTTLEEAKVNLNQLLSRAPDTKFSVEDTVIISYKPTYDQLKNTVFQRNNELLFTGKNVQISEYSLRQTQSLRYPKISLSGNYLYSKATNSAGLVLLNQNQGFNYGFTASMPIFHGLTINNEVKNARLSLTNTQLQFDQTKLQIESSLINSFHEFEINLELLKLEEENIQYARESMTIALERFRVGLSNFVDLRVAQTSFEEAVARLVSARYNAKISESNLMKLNGDLVK